MRLIFTFVLGISLFLVTNASAADCVELGKGRSYVATDAGHGKRNRGYTCARVTVQPGYTGVVTVRSRTGNGDWDVLAGSGFNTSTRTVSGVIGEGRARGSSELVPFSDTSGGRYTVVVWPVTRTPSTVCVVYHQFSTEQIIGEALAYGSAQWFLENLMGSPDQDAEQRRDISHAVSIGLSAFKGRDVAMAGYDSILNEISFQLAEAFGGGAWITTVGVNYFGGYLEQAGRYAFGPSQAC